MSETGHQRSSDGPAEILLVEDNPGDVRLTREGFETTETETSLHVVDNGADAVDFVKQQGDYEQAPRPQIALLDLNLPRKSGREVLEEIRDLPSLQRLPVVVLTSSEDSEDVERCYEADANAYVTKPTDPTDFIETVGAFERFWLRRARLPPIPRDR